MKTMRITHEGRLIGTYVGSEKAFDRAISMFKFTSDMETFDDIIAEWDQIASEFGLQFRKVESFELALLEE